MIDLVVCSYSSVDVGDVLFRVSFPVVLVRSETGVVRVRCFLSERIFQNGVY